MDILDLLRREICRESIAHSPRVPGSVEAMRLAIEEIEKMRQTAALTNGASGEVTTGDQRLPPEEWLNLRTASEIETERKERRQQFNFDVHERATDLMARWLMRFREGDPGWDGEPSENDKLSAGILAGALSANYLLAIRLLDHQSAAASSAVSSETDGPPNQS